MSEITIPGLPFKAAWAVQPVRAWSQGGTLHIDAPAHSELFTSPQEGVLDATSPRLMFSPPDATFRLWAHVSVGFKSTFDAGVIVTWVDDEHWAKLCFEYSPQGEPMVVSVVTNGVSDDANCVALTRRDIYLRVSRNEPSIAFHYSEDGVYWRLVRHFALQRSTPLMMGLAAQSPKGEGASAVFDKIRYASGAVMDIRSGE